MEKEKKKHTLSGFISLTTWDIAAIAVVSVLLYLLIDGNVSFQFLHPNQP